MNVSTFVRQDHYKNWRAESTVMISDTLQLSVVTMKRSSGRLLTSASVGKVERGYISHTVYQDYSKNVLVSTPKKVTCKAVEAQHQLVDMEEVVAEALKFYQIADHTIEFDTV
jgi:hypothetical protein